MYCQVFALRYNCITFGRVRRRHYWRTTNSKSHCSASEWVWYGSQPCAFVGSSSSTCPGAGNTLWTVSLARWRYELARGGRRQQSTDGRTHDLFTHIYPAQSSEALCLNSTRRYSTFRYSRIIYKCRRRTDMEAFYCFRKHYKQNDLRRGSRK